MLLKDAHIARDTWGHLEPDHEFCDRQYGESMTYQEAAIYWNLPKSERDAYEKSIKRGKYSKCYNPD